MLEREEMHSVRCGGECSRRGLKKRLSRLSLISSCLGQAVLERLGREIISKEYLLMIPYLKLFGTIV